MSFTAESTEETAELKQECYFKTKTQLKSTCNSLTLVYRSNETFKSFKPISLNFPSFFYFSEL